MRAMVLPRLSLGHYPTPLVRLDAASAQVSALTEQRDQLVREIGELQEEIDFVQTDAYVERAARDELGLIMPGEVRYVNAAS